MAVSLPQSQSFPLLLLPSKSPVSFGVFRYPFQSKSSSLWNSRIHSKFLPKWSHVDPNSKIWRIYAVSDNVLPSEASIEKAQEIIQADDGSGYTVISALFLAAFVGLTVLTLGVIYIAVNDFLGKKEREKFEKEEAEKKKNDGKKKKVRAKTGPKGFGQKVEEDEV